MFTYTGEGGRGTHRVSPLVSTEDLCQERTKEQREASVPILSCILRSFMLR